MNCKYNLVLLILFLFASYSDYSEASGTLDCNTVLILNCQDILQGHFFINNVEYSCSDSYYKYYERAIYPLSNSVSVLIKDSKNVVLYQNTFVGQKYIYLTARDKNCLESKYNYQYYDRYINLPSNKISCPFSTYMNNSVCTHGAIDESGTSYGYFSNHPEATNIFKYYVGTFNMLDPIALVDNKTCMSTSCAYSNCVHMNRPAYNYYVYTVPFNSSNSNTYNSTITRVALREYCDMSCLDTYKRTYPSQSNVNCAHTSCMIQVLSEVSSYVKSFSCNDLVLYDFNTEPSYVNVAGSTSESTFAYLKWQNSGQTADSCSACQYLKSHGVSLVADCSDVNYLCSNPLNHPEIKNIYSLSAHKLYIAQSTVSPFNFVVNDTYKIYSNYFGDSTVISKQSTRYLRNTGFKQQSLRVLRSGVRGHEYTEP
ncbi:MAG: hypothetical protein H7844_14365 [Nitrospirae bacterium YQR-1]